MSVTDTCFDIDLDELFSKALRDWFSRFSAKDLMQTYHVEERTANSWKQGNKPQEKYFKKMARAWGVPFILGVYGPLIQLSEIQNAQIQLEIAKQAIHVAGKGLADAQKVLRGNSESFGTSGSLSRSSGVMDFVKGLTASLIVGLGLLAGASTILPQHEDMARVRTVRVRVIRTETAHG